MTSHSGEEPQEEETKANTDEGARNTTDGPQSEKWPGDHSRFLGEGALEQCPRHAGFPPAAVLFP